MQIRLLNNIIHMNNIGYINTAYLIGDIWSQSERMKQCGCSNIHVDSPKGRRRPEWDKFIDSLEKGGSAVLVSFDNAFRNFNDMVFFIKYCSKMEIRIISLHDELDTHDLLFPEKKTASTLDLICQVFAKRDRNSHDDLEAELYSNEYNDKKLKRYKLVINMYKAGYSVKEIMERTGYRGKSNIYRVLHKYDVNMEYPSMSRAANKPQVSSI